MTESRFVALVRDHQNIVHKICHLYGNGPEDREDLFQEILLQAWKGVGSFRGEAKFSTWLYQVGLNTAISRLRKADRRPRETSLEGPMLHYAETPNVGGDAEVDALYRAIGELSEVDKALVMLYLEDYDYKTIGDIVGITPNHVAVKMMRVKAKLKELAQKYL